MSVVRGRLWLLLGVVALLSLTAFSLVIGTRSAAAQGGAVSIVDFAFQPATLEVTTGSTVTWTNTGAAPHTVSADDGSFDSGTLSPGSTFSQTFDSAGTFTYHCNIHPNMTASIVVGEGGGSGAQAPAAAEQPAAAATTPAAAGAVQVPKVGVGAMPLDARSPFVLQAAISALALGVAAVAFRRA
jgi:plastocyanin